MWICFTLPDFSPESCIKPILPATIFPVFPALAATGKLHRIRFAALNQKKAACKQTALSGNMP
jgi:hypothetical protein